jgi:hypothetical protein
MKQIRECKYSAFVSYANDDNTAWYRWVSKFTRELEQVLGGRARVKNVPPPFFGDDTPAVAGRLSMTLETAVASSFAMIIVVHDNYAQSDWCLQELDYFRSRFGDSGFLERLYIVAMSESAMEAVKQKDTWQQLCPNEDQVWLPFFQQGRRDEPVNIYQGMEDGKGVLSNEFLKPFDQLVSDLAAKITRSANAAALKPDAVASQAPLPLRPASLSAALFATSVATSVVTAAATPPATPRGGMLLGVAAPELADSVAALRARLADAGQQVKVLGREALFGGFPEFDAAGWLVLPFNDAQPLLPYEPGGHLAVQSREWLKRGKPPDSLVWLDLRDVPAAQPALAEQANFVAALGAKAVSPAALVARLVHEVPAPAPPDTEDTDDTDTQAVRIYIESNQNERLLWKPLGEQIKKKWDKLVAGQQIAPPLFVRPRGLPIDEIDRHPPLDDADGVVLFWGKKEPRSLRSQIDKVENRLRGRDVAPCIVAYLMPPQPDPKQPIVSWAWDVLRFNAAVDQDIDVSPDDTSELDAFLQKILERSSKKRAAGAPGLVSRP